jgi:hypothetical protein
MRWVHKWQTYMNTYNHLQSDCEVLSRIVDPHGSCKHLLIFCLLLRNNRPLTDADVACLARVLQSIFKGHGGLPKEMLPEETQTVNLLSKQRKTKRTNIFVFLFRQCIIEPMMDIYTFKHTKCQEDLLLLRGSIHRCLDHDDWCITGNEKHTTIIRSSPLLLYPYSPTSPSHLWPPLGSCSVGVSHSISFVPPIQGERTIL